jgi:hypothetical protein
MDFEAIAADWLRAARGKRSQRGFSKRLGYGSNIAYRWETGVCSPTASQAFALIKRGGEAGARALRAFFSTSPQPAELQGVDLATREGVALLLRGLRGRTSIVELARRSGHSRFAIARWLHGSAQPRLPELLSLIEATTFRLLDFLACFTNIDALPSVAGEYRSHEAARQTAYDVPWSHAVLRALELVDYEALPRHRRGWLAKRLGISLHEEQRCLAALSAARQIHLRDRRWVVDRTQAVDTRAEPARARVLKAEWLRVALSRLEAGVSGSFGYNIMSVSCADLDKLRELHAAYFRSMQALVADSTPGERVVLFNTQLFAIDDPAAGA